MASTAPTSVPKNSGSAPSAAPVSSIQPSLVAPKPTAPVTPTTATPVKPVVATSLAAVKPVVATSLAAASAPVVPVVSTDASRKRKPGEVAPSAAVDVKRPAPVTAVTKTLASKSSTSVPPPPGLVLTKTTAGGSLPKTGAPHVQSAVPPINLVKGAPNVPSGLKPTGAPPTTTTTPLPIPTATRPIPSSNARAPVVPPSLVAKGVTLPPGAGRLPFSSKVPGSTPVVKPNSVKIIPGVTTSLVGLRKGAPVVGSKAPTVPKASAPPLTVAQSAALKAARARAGTTAALGGARRPSVPAPPGLNLTKQPTPTATSTTATRTPSGGSAATGKTTPSIAASKAASAKSSTVGKSPLSIPALTTAQVYAQAKLKVAAAANRITSGSRATSGGASAAASAAAAAAGKLEADTKGFSKADKRAHHNALERKRRDHIKDTLQGEKQSSRAQILNKATDYIIQMRKKNQVHQDEMERLKLENEDLDRQTAALLQNNSNL